MNKTLTINLSGIVFHIDENAYEMFSVYIESLRRHFASSEGKDEIMQDIESRIAEMFQQRVGESKQVITLHDVEEVTAAMGKPEQFGDEEETRKEEIPHPGIKRRLFRNEEDEVVGGVCSGIGSYFGIDPVWIRLAFVIALIFFGTGILLYIILWIVIPEAKTTADKLMMRGEQVTISNIEKNVREEFDEVKKKFQSASTEVKEKLRVKDYSGFTGFLRRFFDGFGEVLGFIFNGILKIIGFLFIVTGLAVFIACLLALLAVAGVSFIKFPAIAASFFTTSALSFWALLSVLLIIGIPFLLLFYKGLRLLFGIKQKAKMIVVPAVSLMIAGWILAFTAGIFIAKKYSERANVREELKLLQPAGDTLFVSMKFNNTYLDDEDLGPCEDWYILSDTSTTIMGPVKVDIKRSAGDKYELTKVVFSRGASRRKAMENGGGVALAYAQRENKLVLDNYFQLTENTVFGFQEAKFVIGLPVGKMIRINKDMGHALHRVENITDTYDYDMAGHTWKMTENGLLCLDCSGNKNLPGDEEATGSGDDDPDSVIIDSTGLVIRKNGKDVLRIDEKGVTIKNAGN